MNWILPGRWFNTGGSPLCTLGGCCRTRQPSLLVLKLGSSKHASPRRDLSLTGLPASGTATCSKWHASGTQPPVRHTSCAPGWPTNCRARLVTRTLLHPVDVTGAKTSIRFHVAHTSCWVKKYRTAGNDYYTDELTYCVSTFRHVLACDLRYHYGGVPAVLLRKRGCQLATCPYCLLACLIGSVSLQRNLRLRPWKRLAPRLALVLPLLCSRAMPVWRSSCPSWRPP